MDETSRAKRKKARPGTEVHAAESGVSIRAWCVYLLECRGGVMYAGITNDLQARFKAHLAGRGARFTRANPPQRILVSKTYPDRSGASKAEWALKQLPRAKKIAFLTD